MLDWLQPLSEIGVPGVLGVPPQKSATSSGTPLKSVGVPGVPEHRIGTPGTPAKSAGVPAKPLKLNEEHPEHREHLKNSEVALILNEWHGQLAALDPYRAPDGWAPARWRQLVEDARWFIDKYGDQAARDRWDTSNVFGLWPGKPGWGGLVDRLSGSRSLVLTADRAHWRARGEVDRYNRASYPDLRPFWKAGAQR